MHPTAGETYGEGISPQGAHLKSQHSKGEPPWAPWDSYEEFEFVEWLQKSNVTQGAIDQLLKLEFVELLPCTRKCR